MVTRNPKAVFDGKFGSTGGIYAGRGIATAITPTSNLSAIGLELIGLIADEAVTYGTAPETGTWDDHDGHTFLTYMSSEPTTLGFTALQVGLTLLKMRYGIANVSIADGFYVIKGGAREMEDWTIVFDFNSKPGKRRLVVFPVVYITNGVEKSLDKENPDMYPFEGSAMIGVDGSSYTEYLEDPAPGAGGDAVSPTV